MKFSKLDKNEKTYEHVLLYYEAFLNKSPLISVSNQIQKRELQNHLERYNCTESNQEACLEWLQNNAENFRHYINSLVAITEFLMIDIKINYRSGLIKRIFFNAVDVWNEHVELMEFIRMSDKV